jgi:hypothetical protein
MGKISLDAQAQSRDARLAELGVQVDSVQHGALAGPQRGTPAGPDHKGRGLAKEANWANEANSRSNRTRRT